jgi:hypothetical protein
MSNLPKPSDLTLYNYVKKLADKKFASKSGIYKSSWIVREYKKRGGKYTTKKSRKLIGLRRWYKEKWVDLNRPIKSHGKIIDYEECGRESAKINSNYPLCRPSIKVTADTPKTYKEISEKSIEKAKKEKKKVKGSKNIQFGGKSNQEKDESLVEDTNNNNDKSNDKTNDKSGDKTNDKTSDKSGDISDENSDDNSFTYGLAIMALFLVFSI